MPETDPWILTRFLQFVYYGNFSEGHDQYDPDYEDPEPLTINELMWHSTDAAEFDEAARKDWTYWCESMMYKPLTDLYHMAQYFGRQDAADWCSQRIFFYVDFSPEAIGDPSLGIWDVWDGFTSEEIAADDLLRRLFAKGFAEYIKPTYSEWFERLTEACKEHPGFAFELFEECVREKDREENTARKALNDLWELRKGLDEAAARARRV